MSQHQRAYWQKYRKPFAEPKVPIGPESKGPIDTAESIAGDFMFPKGKAKRFRLPPFRWRYAKDVQLERRAVRPDDPRFVGLEKVPSVLERIVIRELERRHLVQGRDWDAQEVNLPVGNGGTILHNTKEWRPDIMLYYPRVCIIEVQGIAWHRGIVDRQKDIGKEFLARALGITETLYIWEDTLESDTLTQRWFKENLGL